MASTSTPARAQKASQTNSSATALLESLRPGQWLKNGFVLAPLIFSHNLTDWHRDVRAGLAALCFCLTASLVYLVNDVLDASEDRNHPLKRLRPVAAGRLSVRTAVAAALSLGLVTLAGAWALEPGFALLLTSYLALNLLYSWLLKRIVLLDVFVVAAGFLLRVIGGAVVIHVEFSSWLIVCTTFVALFLALSKRRHELLVLGEGASNHRAILVNYSPYFLDQLIAIVTASTVMSYALYTLSADVRAKFPGKRLELTIPFVLFGIFRYLYLVHQKEEGGNPTRVLLTDAALLAVVLMWAAAVVLIIYL